MKNRPEGRRSLKNWRLVSFFRAAPAVATVFDVGAGRFSQDQHLADLLAVVGVDQFVGELPDSLFGEAGQLGHFLDRIEALHHIISSYSIAPETIIEMIVSVNWWGFFRRQSSARRRSLAISSRSTSANQPMMSRLAHSRQRGPSPPNA